jgi:hypothetical protein
MIPPNLRNRLHYQHPHPRRSQSQTDSFNTVQGGGQFYASITPQTGSILHADLHTLVAIQLWVALRFANFVVPLVVGIGGTLVALAVMITRTQQADWFPWVLPFNTLVTPTPERYAMVGLFIGMAIIAAMVPALTRHQFR